MKFYCEKDTLNCAMQVVQKAVSHKNIMKILSGVLIEAKNNIVFFKATDFETYIIYKIETEIIKEGAVVIAGKYFQDVIKLLPKGKILIEEKTEKNMLEISIDKIRYSFLTMPATEFPKSDESENKKSIIIKSDDLIELIKKTNFSCSIDDTRPIFTGALMEIKQNEIKMIATNTHRMAIKKIRLDENNNELKAVIPSKILNELVKLLSISSINKVKVNLEKKQILFSFGDIIIRSKVIEGQFPDYKKVIPCKAKIVVEINKIEAIKAIERILLISRGNKYNIVKLKFIEEKILFNANSENIGEAVEEIKARKNGDDIEINFNGKYIVDIFKTVEQEKIIFLINTADSPVVIKNKDVDDYIYVVTPIRIT